MLQAEEAQGSQAELRRGFTQPTTLMTIDDGGDDGISDDNSDDLYRHKHHRHHHHENEHRDMSVATF